MVAFIRTFKNIYMPHFNLFFLKQQKTSQKLLSDWLNVITLFKRSPPSRTSADCVRRSPLRRTKAGCCLQRSNLKPLNDLIDSHFKKPTSPHKISSDPKVNIYDNLTRDLIAINEFMDSIEI